MLKKLYYYEWVALRRILIPLYIVMPVLATLCFLLARLVAVVPAESLLGNLLTILFATAIFFSAVAIAMIFLAIALILGYRYYRSFFTDEGYLTMVLPVRGRTLFLAKVASGATWGGVALVIAVLSFLLMAWGASSTLVGSAFEIYISTAPGVPAVVTVLITVLNVCASLFLQLILMYGAINLAGLVFRKYSILGAVLFYLVSNTALSILSSLIQAVVLVFLAPLTQNPNMLSVISFYSATAISLLLDAAIIVAVWLMSVHVLEKKLNLS